MDMNKYSNNFMAEQVLKTVGAEKFGEGSLEKGLRWTRSYLVSLGLSAEDFTLVNGSGLSRDSFLKPTVLTAILRDMGEDNFVGNEFKSSLAIAGLDGTLWKRMRSQSGLMRGKTGTINGVHCLTGYFQTADGTEYAYAFLMNGLRGRISRAKKLQDKMLTTMIGSAGSMAQNEELKGDSGK
jgi:D-alanyl-D-alanine carboxypeptidase/D-alanyl-D-alanine-endopeptidase (penicillin-binding protein 4)